MVDEVGPSQFGRWLNKVRQKKDLSVEALAEESGVSFVQIYNIEAGRSQNPRDRTRKKLTDALEEKPGTKILSATESAANIEGVGEYIDFDPHDESDMPEEAGLYVFYDVSERPIYVGQSKNIRARIKSDHATRFWFKEPIVQSAAYVGIKELALRKKIEKVMIKFMKSNAVINKHHVDREEGE